MNGILSTRSPMGISGRERATDGDLMSGEVPSDLLPGFDAEIVEFLRAIQESGHRTNLWIVGLEAARFLSHRADQRCHSDRRYYSRTYDEYRRKCGGQMATKPTPAAARTKLSLRKSILSNRKVFQPSGSQMSR